MRPPLVFVLLTLATSAFGAPVITSVNPSSGPISGGTAVTIRGTGFSTCIICSPPVPPAVFFGGTPAESVQLVDPTHLEAVAPRHLPGAVDVTVGQFDGSATLSNAFTFTGQAEDEFEIILLPVFSPPIQGAQGSQFHTIARAVTKSDSTRVQLYGIDLSCTHPAPPGMDVFTLVGKDLTYQLPICSPGPARLLYVPKGQAADLSMNVRVLDVTRQATSHGTEIPVVRAERMTSSRIVLIGVPISNRLRSTLRIYALRPAVVFVTTVGAPQAVPLQPGRNEFEPAYAQFTSFPIPIDRPDAGTINVTIEQPNGIIAGPPMWAFITVTNNETQQITTISPD
jgi:IPT/TIG domain-containing protein